MKRKRKIGKSGQKLTHDTARKNDDKQQSQRVEQAIHSKSHDKSNQSRESNIDRAQRLGSGISLTLAIGGVFAATLALLPNMADQIGSHKTFNFWCYFAAIAVGQIAFEVAGTMWWLHLRHARAHTEPPTHDVATNNPPPTPSAMPTPSAATPTASMADTPTIIAKQDKAQQSLDEIKAAVVATMAAYQKSHAPDLSKEFPLGYSLFTMKGRDEIIRYQVPSTTGAVFHWDTASVQITNEFITIKLPNIDFDGGGHTESISRRVPNEANVNVNALSVVYRSSDGTKKSASLFFKLIDSERGDRMGVLGLKLLPEPQTPH